MSAEELKQAEDELLALERQIRALKSRAITGRASLEKKLARFWQDQTGIRERGFMASGGRVWRVVRFAWTDYRFDPERPPQVVVRQVMRNASGGVLTKNENRTLPIGTPLQANAFADALAEAEDMGLTENG